MRAIALALATLVLAPACRSGGDTPGDAVSLSLDRDVLRLRAAGETASVGAEVVDAERRVVSGAAMRWWSSDPEVAQVSPNGLVTARANGVTRVWASIGADSVSALVVVELPPERIQFAILPGRVRFDAIGDTMLLELTPVALPDTLVPVDLADVCLSENEAVAVVAIGGFVTALGNGVTRVRCRVGEEEETVEVRVRQRATRIAIIADRNMRVKPLEDTLALVLARVDRRGEPIPSARPSWTTLDPEVVQVDSASGTVVGVEEGTGRVVAQLHGLVDTATIQVSAETPVEVIARRPRIIARRPRRGRAQAQQRAAGAGDRRGRGRGRGRGLGAALGARRWTPREGVFAQVPADASMVFTKGVSFWTDVRHAEHRVDVGAGVDKTAGLMFGGGIKWTIATRLEVLAYGSVGKLTSDVPGVLDRTVNDAHFDVNVGALPWLTFTVGTGLRSYVTDAATERWTSIRTGGEARFDLMEGALRAVFRGYLLPVVSVSGLGESPNLGFEAGAGVEYRSGKLTSGLYYSLERYDFPRVGGIERREQFTTLRFRVGLELGGRRR